MSYPKDLDEYTDRTLLDEIARRYAANAINLCAYCGRTLRSEPFCLKTEQHIASAFASEVLLLELSGLTGFIGWLAARGMSNFVDSNVRQMKSDSN